MKRTMKKHLSLLIAVLMLITSVGMNVIAVGEHECKTNFGNPEYYNVVEPTCETQGYTEYLCVICKQVVSVGDYTNALGHTLGEDDFEQVDGAWYKYRECTREYTTNGVVDPARSCKFKSYETENGEKTVYHKVTFVNNKVTAAYDESITYTNIAKEFKNQELYSDFVKHGEKVEYEGKITPYREKTVHYSTYKCIGWNTENKEATAENNLTASDCMDLSSVKSDLVLYPVFEGFKDVYGVVFYNNEGENTTWLQNVTHGGYPKYSDPDGKLYPNPTKEEDIFNYYKFNGWSTELNQTSGVDTENIESTPVYADMHYHPAFEPLAKKYVIEFYDEQGKNKVASFSGVNLKTNFYQNKGVYEEILKYSLTKLTKASDKEYHYVWAGWKVLRGDNTSGTSIVTMDKYGNYTFNGFDGIVAKDIINRVDEKGETVYYDGELPEGLTKNNKEPEKVIRLVPVFEKRLQSYVVDIEMQLPTSEDSDYFKGDAVVHVVDKNQQLAASGKTNAYGKFRCLLNYRTPFTVTVATYDNKYLGTATITDLVRASGSDEAEAEINKCRVVMKLNPEYETHCSCIHHNSLLQPIFVRILNILYTFFNVKYVCCYDMASTIGPLLDYVDDAGNII